MEKEEKRSERLSKIGGDIVVPEQPTGGKAIVIMHDAEGKPHIDNLSQQSNAAELELAINDLDKRVNPNKV